MLEEELTEYKSRRNAIPATWKRFRYGLGMHQLPYISNLVVVDGNVNKCSYIDFMGGNLLESASL